MLTVSVDRERKWLYTYQGSRSRTRKPKRSDNPRAIALLALRPDRVHYVPMSGRSDEPDTYVEYLSQWPSML